MFLYRRRVWNSESPVQIDRFQTPSLCTLFVSLCLTWGFGPRMSQETSPSRSVVVQVPDTRQRPSYFNRFRPKAELVKELGMKELLHVYCGAMLPFCMLVTSPLLNMQV